MANVSSNNLTTLYSGSGVSIRPTSAYGNSNVVSLLNAGTDGGNTVTNIVATGNMTIDNITANSNVTADYFIGNFVGNVSNSNYANFAGTAFNVSGSNVTGQVAFAAVANSVAVANVVGIGNIATINLDGNVSNILHGDGSFGPESGNLNANYANFAGTVITNAQPNITSVGTLTGLNVNGNANIFGTLVMSASTTNQNDITGVNNGSNATQRGLRFQGGNVQNPNIATNQPAGAFTMQGGYSTSLTDTGTAWNAIAGGFILNGGVAYTANGQATSGGFSLAAGAATSDLTGRAIGGNITITSGTAISNNNTANSGEITIRSGFSVSNNVSRTGNINLEIGYANGVSGNTVGNINIGTLNVVDAYSPPTSINIGQANTPTVIGGNVSALNANLGNLATANYFSGDGSLLSNINGSNVSNVANANYSNFAGTLINGTSNISFSGSNGNITFTNNGISNVLIGNTTLNPNVITPPLGTLSTTNQVIVGPDQGNFNYPNGTPIRSFTRSDTIWQAMVSKTGPGDLANGALGPNDSLYKFESMGYLDWNAGGTGVENGYVYSTNLLGINEDSNLSSYIQGFPPDNTQRPFGYGYSSTLFQGYANINNHDMNYSYKLYGENIRLSVTDFTSGFVAGQANITLQPTNNGNSVSFVHDFNGNLTIPESFNGNSANITANITAGNINGGNLVSANYLSGDGYLISNLVISGGTQILNGNSNVVVSPNSNVSTSVAGVANVMVVSNTGANVIAFNINNGNVELPTKQFDPIGITVGSNANILLMSNSSFVDVDYGNGQGGGNLRFGKATTYVKARGNSSSIASAAANDVVGRTNYMYYNGTSNVLAVSTQVNATNFNSNANAITTGAQYQIITGNPNGDQGNANALSNQNLYTFDNGGRLSITTGAATGAGSYLALSGYGITAGGNGVQSQAVNFVRYRGNRDANLSVEPNDQLGSFSFLGYNGASLFTARSASLQGIVDSTYVANATAIPTGFKLTSTSSTVQNDNWFYSNANVRFGLVSGGNTTFRTDATVFVNNLDVAGNVANIAGNLNVVQSANITGNLSSGNANLGNLAIANFFSGDGSLLTNITSGNVTGQVANALVAGTVYTNAQPNITSVGTLTDLTVSGNANIGNLKLNRFQETVYAIGSTSGTITPDFNNGSIQTMTLTGNITMNTLGNAIAGRSMTLILTQDGTGGRTLTSSMLFSDGYKTLSGTGGSKDIISVFYDGSSYYAVLSKGYA